MIEVKLYLDDEHELEVFRIFAEGLMKHRRARYDAACAEAIPMSEMPTVVVGAPPALNTEPTAYTREGEPPVRASFESVVTMPQLEEALKAFGRTHGFPAARALLDEYTKGKLGDVPAEKHAKLYAKLTA